MREMKFLQGMGLGLAVGAAAMTAMSKMPQKKALRSGAEKAMKAMGDAVDQISGH
jgi:gas vesicle protein